MFRKFLLFTVLLFVCLVKTGRTQTQPQEPLDGRNHIFRDELLDNLVGDWKLTRKIRGQSAENTVKVEWLLNHQFMLIHMKDVRNPSEYEVMAYIGYDNTSERYVAHWIDVFGGRFSETLGYGKRSGNTVKFLFEYPDGPFTNTFTWNADTKSWVFLMEQKNQSGKWVIFAEDTLRRQ